MMYHHNILIVFHGITKKLALVLLICSCCCLNIAAANPPTTTDSSRVLLSGATPQTQQDLQYGNPYLAGRTWNSQCNNGDYAVGAEQDTFYVPFTYTYSINDNGWASTITGNESTRFYLTNPHRTAVACRNINTNLAWRSAP